MYSFVVGFFLQTLTADVKMLSGTAIGIYLASAPTYGLSVGTFWIIFSNVFLGKDFIRPLRSFQVCYFTA